MSKGQYIDATLLVCGLGNIGSQAALFAARNPAIRRIGLIDHGTFSRSNLRTQNIDRREIGKPKPVVMAQRICAVRNDLEVDCFLDRVEHIPLGEFRGGVILSAVDNRATRQWLNQVAWRLGIPLVDAAVGADGLIARVNVYVPGPDSPCMECSFGEDYQFLEALHPCGSARQAPATGAPAELGALAASLAVVEIRKLLNGDEGAVLVGRQLMIEARHHKQYVARLPVNVRCRFDHRTWKVEGLDCGPDEISVGQTLDLLPRNEGNGGALLHQEGATFVRHLTCCDCGAKTPTAWRLSTRLESAQACRSCGGRCVPTGLDSEAALGAGVLSSQWLNSPLSVLGFRDHDVFSVRGPQEARHFELAGGKRHA